VVSAVMEQLNLMRRGKLRAFRAVCRQLETPTVLMHGQRLDPSALLL
jgi:hypothetical protein